MKLNKNPITYIAEKVHVLKIPVQAAGIRQLALFSSATEDTGCYFILAWYSCNERTLGSSSRRAAIPFAAAIAAAVVDM